MDEPRVSWRGMSAGSKVGVIVVTTVCGTLALGVLAVMLGLLARAVDWAWS
jgi:hypothetical protein